MQGTTLEAEVRLVLAAGGPVMNSITPDVVRLHDDKVRASAFLSELDEVKRGGDACKVKASFLFLNMIRCKGERGCRGCQGLASQK